MPKRATPSVRLGMLLCIPALLLLAPARGVAQYLFGQNKVIYSEKDWKVIETPRVDLYYYVGEQELAEDSVEDRLFSSSRYSPYLLADSGPGWRFGLTVGLGL